MSCDVVNPSTVCPTFNVLYSEGDQLPSLTGVLKDIDLTDYTVRLTLQRPTTVLVKDAALVDATNGVFQINWDDTDLVAGLGQFALLQLIDVTDKSQTLACFKLDIRQVPT